MGYVIAINVHGMHTTYVPATTSPSQGRAMTERTPAFGNFPRTRIPSRNKFGWSASLQLESRGRVAQSEGWGGDATVRDKNRRGCAATVTLLRHHQLRGGS
jgi:hypothetical protein